MKTIYVKVYSAQEAEEYAKNIYRILRDCTPVIADLCLKKAEVRTETVLVKPLCMAWGNADDFKEVIKQLDLCEDSILDVYEEHLKEGVTRDKIKSFMAKEKWFSGAELAEYFDVLIDEKAAVAACASDYFEKYNHVPESIKGTATKDIVDAVLAELENRNNAAAEAEKQRIEAEKQDILADLDMYGI